MLRQAKCGWHMLQSDKLDSHVQKSWIGPSRSASTSLKWFALANLFGIQTPRVDTSLESSNSLCAVAKAHTLSIYCLKQWSIFSAVVSIRERVGGQKPKAQATPGGQTRDAITDVQLSVRAKENLPALAPGREKNRTQGGDRQSLSNRRTASFRPAHRSRVRHDSKWRLWALQNVGDHFRHHMKQGQSKGINSCDSGLIAR